MGIIVRRADFGDLEAGRKRGVPNNHGYCATQLCSARTGGAAGDAMIERKPTCLQVSCHMPVKRSLFRQALFAILGAAAVTPVYSACHDMLAAPELSGKGELCILGFCLYDAQLWSKQIPPSYEAPFALEVTYRRSVARTRLIETAIDEIRRLQIPTPSDDALAKWQKDMTPAFPDVKPGDTICGVYLPGRGARFYANGRLTTEVNDPVFAHAFFDIWLSPGTRAPSLRRSLLGETR